MKFGGGSKNQSCSEMRETWSRFEFLRSDEIWGGWSKNQSCSERRETWSHLEFLRSDEIFEFGPKS